MFRARIAKQNTLEGLLNTQWAEGYELYKLNFKPNGFEAVAVFKKMQPQPLHNVPAAVLETVTESVSDNN